MKRIIAVIMALICVLSFAACGGGTTEPRDITAVKNAIITDLAITDAIDIADKDVLLNTYGIAPEDVSEFACFNTMSGTFPDEVIMINATDEDAAERVAEKLSAHLDQVKIQSKNYDAENYKLAQECQVITEGTTVALFISAKHTAMEEIFNNPNH